MSWRAGHLLAVGAGLVVLTGCWQMPGQGPDRRSHNPFEDQITVETVGSLTEVWGTDLGSDVGSPVVSGAGVVVTARNASSLPVLHTARADSGQAVWTTELSPIDLASAGDPVVNGDQVIVGQGVPFSIGRVDVGVYNTATGMHEGDIGDGFSDTRRESLVGSHEFHAVPQAGYCSTRIEIVDLVDSANSWSSILAVEQDSCPASVAPTIGGSGVYHAGPGPIDLSPDPPTTGNGVRAYTISPPPDCFEGSVRCPTWVTPLDGTTASSPVIGEDGSTLYTGTNAGTLYAVDAATGAIEWSAGVGASITAPPALASGVLFVPTAGRDIVALDANGCGAPTCNPLWKGAGGATVTVQPAVAGGVVFTGGLSGAVKGYDAAGCGSPICAPLWSAATGSEITGAPAVTGGRLFVGTDDGRLIAYSPGGA